MSFFKASKEQKDLEQNTGTSYINKSGCFPVNIIAPFVSASKNGSVSVDLFLDHKGQNQVIYGNMRITNNDGSNNSIGAKVFNQLAVIAGVDDVSEPEENDLPIGKNNEIKPVAVLEDLCDIDVVLRIQMEYSIWNKNIQESKIIRGFYRAGDNASAEEIVNGTEAGVQYAKEEEYFENVTYKDGLDEETVAKWIKDKRPKGTGGAGSAGGSTGAAPKTPKFGAAKGFGSKK